MSVKHLEAVLAHPKPKGLNRLTLSVLAFRADVNGVVVLEPPTYDEIRIACAMQRQRFDRTLRELHQDGIIDIDGSVVRIPQGGPGVGGKGFAPQQPLQGSTAEQGSVRGAAETEVDRVWLHYVEVMKPRRKEAGEEERRIIRAALKVATAEECCRAIDGCRASGFHMGDNPRGKKYNKISNILRGKAGKKTTREQIDMFLDLHEKATAVGTTISSGDPAIIAQRKSEVRRGHRAGDDPEAVRKAEEAEAWLRQCGIVTRRRSDGYPIWGGE